MSNANVILIKGDKHTKPEPDLHIIKFPGGYIEVSRTSDDEYWAHIGINPEPPHEDSGVVEAKTGKIVGGRLDYNNPPGDIRDIEDLEKLTHIAVKISTTKEIPEPIA